MAVNPSRGKRQMLASHMKVRGLTHEDVAQALGSKYTRVNTLIMALSYPTADEIAKLEALIGLPIETMFDANMLKYHKVVKP